MGNPLTGDFEAVLQVSGLTVNRLLASMHQNAFANTTLPSLPHSVTLRVGDGAPIDGMCGSVWAQIGVPQIELIHESSDRFFLEVAIRARYKPDPGTTPLPEFIHGTVRAQYRLESVDPKCWGWSKNASEYVWIRVVRDSVSFTGTAYDDVDNLMITTVIDQTVADARITRLLSVLLPTTFEATPHKAGAAFQPGRLRSLNVGVNRSLVAVPMSLSGAAPSGAIGSINQDLLEGWDFGIGISREYILSKVQPVLDALKAGFKLPIHFGSTTTFLGATVLTVSIDWTITLTKTVATWLAGPLPFGLGGSGGFIVIEISGQALTQKSEFNWSFNATQIVSVRFDAVTEQFVLARFGGASAVVHAGGDYGDEIKANAQPQIQKQMGPAVQAAIDAVAGELEIKSRKQPLVDELMKLGDGGDAHFDEAVFSLDGAVVRGRILLAPRHAPVTAHVLVPGLSAFDAFASWIPGGRVDRFHWSWSWFNYSGDPGSTAVADRFLLRRPLATSQGKFGVSLGLKRPLPGLDGSGQVCLQVSGVYVHPITGRLVPVTTSRRCTRFGVDVRIAIDRVDIKRLFVREYFPIEEGDFEGPLREAALHEVGGARASTYGANTLVLSVDGRWNQEYGAVLRDGLARAARRDAGMQVLVLFRDGTLESAGGRLMREVSELANELEAALIVNEDVHGAWGKALTLRSGSDEPAWRLVTPTGGLSWAHDGRLEPDELARALDTYLFPSAPPAVVREFPGLVPGRQISAVGLEASVGGRYIDHVERQCPPPPLGRLGMLTKVAFVQKHSKASEAAIRQIERQQHGDEGGFVALIVDGVDEKEAGSLVHGANGRVAAIPDPDGIIAHRFGVSVWPTTVALNEAGVVTAVDLGLVPEDLNNRKENGR